MNFFGIGGWELVAFLLIALVVAGPKRMIQWAYVLGVYMAKFRGMWAETMKLIEKEFRNAGLDVEVPKQLPTSRTILREQVSKTFKPITKPINDTLKEVNSSLQITPPANGSTSSGTPAESNGASQDNSSFGTWSGTEKTEK
ncbi:MAG: hypothetical protein U0694_24275 [Anaerolineae bacterium]